MLRLIRRHDLVVLLVEDAFERDPPLGDYPFSTAEGQGGWLRVDLGQKRRRAAELKAADRTARLRRLGAQAVLLSTETRADQNMQTLEQIDG